MKLKRKIIMCFKIFIELFLIIYLMNQFIQPNNTISYTINISLAIIAYIFIRRMITSKKIIRSIQTLKTSENNTQNLYDQSIDLVSHYPLEESFVKVSKLVNDTIREKNQLFTKMISYLIKLNIKMKF